MPTTLTTYVRRPLALLVLLGAMPGCGGVLYTANVLGANAALEEARLADAERLAPYEYYYARSCVEKAREEAGDAEYQHAIELADTARDHALRARDRARSNGGSTASSGGQAESR
jgi:predicted Zn-dependent protease